MRPVRIFHTAPVSGYPNQLSVAYHDCVRGEAADIAAYCAAHPQHIECSTAAPDALGRSLSAFHLRIDHAGFGADGTGYAVEHLYQASKVFQLRDGSRVMAGRAALDAPHPLAAKRMAQQLSRQPGARLIGFQYFNRDWIPVTSLAVPQSYYNWLYCNALHRQPALVEALRMRSVATTSDTKFHPTYGVACQAEAVAVYLASLTHDPAAELLDRMLSSVTAFDGSVAASTALP